MFDLGHLSPEIRWRRPGGAGASGPAFQADLTALSALPAEISFSRATTGTRFNSSGVLVTEAINGPRFDYAWNGSAWVATGLLIEEQRTNEALSSNNFSTTDWFGATLTAAFAISPDGTSNAWRYQYTTGTGVSITQGILLSGGTANKTVTVSCFAKSNTGSSYSVALKNTHGGVVDNLSVITVPPTWQRFQFTVTNGASAGNGQQICGVVSSASGNFFDISIYGYQVEQASVATSYIPTTSAAVTRSADIAQLTGTALAQVLNTTSGTSILVEVADLASSNPSHSGIIGSSAARFAMFRNAGDNYLASYDFGAVGGVVSAGTPGTPTWANTNRCGCSYNSAGFSLDVDGGPVSTGTAPTWGTDTAIGLGCHPGGGNQINGHVVKVAIYSSRLSDADLQTKSVVGASF